MTLLGDGRVLIAGGLSASLTEPAHVLRSAELFDPSSGGIRAVSCPLQHARMRASAAQLPDGRAIIVGGDSLNQVTIPQTEIYDPVTDCFQDGPNLTDPSRSVQGALSMNDGSVLVVEGFGNNSNGGAELLALGASAFVGLDRDLGRATELPALVKLRDGRVLLTGGMEIGSSGFVEPTSRAVLFEPDSHRFRQVAGTMIHPREAHAGAVLGDGRVLIVGGSGSGPYRDAEYFDPATETFAAVASSLSVARVVPTAVSLASGDVLVVGGKPNFGMLPLRLIERYSTACDCFVSAAESAMPAGLGHRTFIDLAGRVIVVRPSNDPPSDTVAEIELLDWYRLR